MQSECPIYMKFVKVGLMVCNINTNSKCSSRPIDNLWYASCSHNRDLAHWHHFTICTIIKLFYPQYSDWNVKIFLVPYWNGILTVVNGLSTVYHSYQTYESHRITQIKNICTNGTDCIATLTSCTTFKVCITFLLPSEAWKWT